VESFAIGLPRSRDGERAFDVLWRDRDLERVDLRTQQ
jgi:hypothetical protein